MGCGHRDDIGGGFGAEGLNDPGEVLFWGGGGEAGSWTLVAGGRGVVGRACCRWLPLARLL